MVVNADVAKLYRMIQIEPQDYLLQSISGDPYEPTCEFSTMLSAPYLAYKYLQHLAEDGKLSHSVASTDIEKNFYVDDMHCTAKLTQLTRVGNWYQIQRSYAAKLQQHEWS